MQADATHPVPTYSPGECASHAEGSAEAAPGGPAPRGVPATPGGICGECGAGGHDAPAEGADGHAAHAGLQSHAARGEALAPAGEPPTLGARVWTGAWQGALVGGGLSAWRNAWAASRGEKPTSAAIRDAAVDTAAATAVGALTSSLAWGASHGLRGIGLRAAARSAVPGALAVIAVDVGRDALALSRQDMDTRRFRERLAVHAFRGGTTWVGLEVGAAMGTLGLPLLGPVLGALAGGIAGYRIGTWLAEDRPGEEG